MQETIGERLKIARIREKLTLQELSAKCGLSKSFLSQIERGEVTPSLGSLMKVARSLDISLMNLFSETEGTEAGGLQDLRVHPFPGRSGGYVLECQLVKKNKRKTITPAESTIVYSLLTPDLNRKMEILHTKAAPGQESGGQSIVHDGEECCFVIRGRLEIQVGEKVFTLEEGDSLYFPTRTPHRWKNAGDGPMEAIWAMTPPWF